MKILVLIANPCVNDARVIREAEALAEAGHSVVVYATWRSGLPTEETRSGVVYRRRPGRALDAVQLRSEEASRRIAGAQTGRGARQWSWIELYMATRGATRWVRPIIREAVTPTAIELLRNAHYFRDAGIERPDVVHAHELATLLVGSRIARRTGARLVYDSHELETGRNGIWGAWELWLRGMAERRLIRRADRVITVSESIARHLAELYAISKPDVILNAPTIEPCGENASSRSLRRELGLGPDVPLAVYVGNVTRNRGLEQAVESLGHAPELHIAAVGPREPDVESKLRQTAERLGVMGRLHLVDPVPHAEVTSYVGSAGVSLILIQDVCLSYRYCFPNKLLESLLAGLPVVAGRLVEVERVIGGTGTGVIVDQTDPRAIAEGIREVLVNRSHYAPNHRIIDEIAQTYGWNVQRQRLIALYEDLSKAGAR